MEKAQATASGDAYILAGDTVVAVGRRILPKTEMREEALACLKLMSGRRHRVLSSIALRHPDGTIRERLSETVVWIQGSHSGVMGLPLYETRALLKAAGFTIA